MPNSTRLVNNIFGEKKLSEADLRGFAEEHLVRLSQPENNPGSIYSAIIAVTTPSWHKNIA